MAPNFMFHLVPESATKVISIVRYRAFAAMQTGNTIWLGRVIGDTLPDDTHGPILACLLVGYLHVNLLGFYGPHNIGAKSLRFLRASEVSPVRMDMGFYEGIIVTALLKSLSGIRGSEVSPGSITPRYQCASFSAHSYTASSSIPFSRIVVPAKPPSHLQA